MIGYTLHVKTVEAVADVVVRVRPDPATGLLVGTVTTTVGSIRVGDVAGDTLPEVGFGDLAAGATATMTFEVLIVDPLRAARGHHQARFRHDLSCGGREPAP